MPKRKIIRIDEKKCTGCGLCIPNCPEGALKIIDGKARLISDLFCDGLGACIGHCPQGAITTEERGAEPYDEIKVMGNIVKQGRNVIKAHLEHLREHGQIEYLKEAIEYLKERNIEIPLEELSIKMHRHHLSGCPGAKAMDFVNKKEGVDSSSSRSSELRQWPIQLHLVSSLATHYHKADVLLSADCVAYTVGEFHKDFLRGKSLAIACPKLDEGQDVYVEKIKSLIDDAKINTLTVMTMQVPCCHGLVDLAKEAGARAKRKIPIKSIVISLEGEVLSEEWL